uniref:EMI domain-containing protein n=1 Tax=Setaria digitata TaxID=48799 RepID=A0A915PYD9_9BILA
MGKTASSLVSTASLILYLINESTVGSVLMNTENNKENDKEKLEYVENFKLEGLLLNNWLLYLSKSRSSYSHEYSVAVLVWAEELNLQRYEQAVVLHTTKPCWDISQGFRCKVKTNGTKLSYKALPTKKKTITYKCCFGYYETPEGTCEICLEGYYGSNCSFRCNCSKNEMCDNVIGCCDPLTKPCRVLQTAAVKELVDSSGWLFPALLASLSAVVLLLFGTFFYRRKYKKEKDPDLPTLTYYPNGKELLPTGEVETREFNNPMYRRSALETVPIKIIPDEPVPTMKSGQPRDEYATLDYAAPSSMEHLLKIRSIQSPYEVPFHSTPSPSTRSVASFTDIGKEYS